MVSSGGYISISDLAEAFNVQIYGRPLIVEGLIARPIKSDKSESAEKSWKVFFDTERYGVSTEGVSNDCEATPIPERLRFTLAHEIAHTLSFRADDFGIDSTSKRGSKDTVSQLEAEANFMAPLLLVSEKYLDFYISAISEFGINELIELKSKMALSREVLISKLASLRQRDTIGLLNRNLIRGTILGIGVWKSTTNAQLMGWPLLLNFENSLIPEFIHRIRNGNVCNLTEILPFMSSPAERDVWKFENDYKCGTQKNPSLESSTFTMEIETVSKKKGNTFFFKLAPTLQAE